MVKQKGKEKKMSGGYDGWLLMCGYWVCSPFHCGPHTVCRSQTSSFLCSHGYIPKRMEDDDDTSLSQTAMKAGRKRPRQALSLPVAAASPAPAETNKNDNYNDADDGDETSPSSVPLQQELVLAPHTLRLLKLVEEGSVEHARLAAAQLSEITAGSSNSSPVVLWDILGRLQGFLTSPHWRTRQNASIAMEGVARQLPASDQRDFLEHTAVFHRDKDNTQDKNVDGGEPNKNKNNDSNSSAADQQQQQQQQQEHTWLTLEDLNEHWGTILKEGRTLLSSSETKYDQMEEEMLNQLDAGASKGGPDFVARRIHLQRQILARRLGLSPILSEAMTSGTKNKKTVVEGVLSEDDLLPYRSTKSPSRKKAKGWKNIPKNNADASSASNKSIRGLLVLEIQQQQQQQQKSQNMRDGPTYRAIQHQTAQRLLATELVFRMFDASWYIRHGSLMGILALMRAWKVHETVQFGIWPHDIMSRCLCVLALDRFADYSETATSSESGGIVAPVREMAGQVFSLLYQAAPQSCQRSGLEALLKLLTNDHDQERKKDEASSSEGNDWEIRYAALLTLKYISALRINLPTGDSTPAPVDKIFLDRTLGAATAALGDVGSDDVRGVAAQVLVTIFSNHDIAALYKHSPFVPRIVRHLWESLSPSSTIISSSIKDLVSLFSTWICLDFSLVVDNIPLDQTKNEEPCILLLSRLQMLTTCPYLSVKTTVVGLVGSVAKRLEEYSSEGRIKVDNDQSRSGMAVAFCDVMRAVFGLYFERANDEDVCNQDMEAFVATCGKTWVLLAKASVVILRDHEKQRSELETSMMLDYFGLLPDLLRTNVDIATFTESSFGSRHRLQLDVANALAVLLSESDMSEKNASLDILELCLRMCLDSPFVSHCERACFLLTSLCRSRTGLPISSVLKRCKDGLIQVVLGTPECLAVDKQSLYDSRMSMLKVLSSSLDCGIQSLSKLGETVDTATRKVSMLWKEATVRHRIHHTSDVAVSLNSMRLFAVSSGALVAGGIAVLPTKLTPIVRSLMTAIQNEVDLECQATTGEHMVALLEMLSSSSLDERQEASQRTKSKILHNLCQLIKSSAVPGGVVASRIVAETVSKAALPLQSYPPVWESISPLVKTTLASEKEIVEGLLLLEAVCAGLGGNKDTTSLAIKTFLAPVATLCCTSANDVAQKHAAQCVEMMAAANQTVALETVLPTIALMCKEEDDSTRERACDLLSAVINGPTMSLCPYVRSMLPLAMQLMTDPSAKCAKKAARIFSKLVQLAPLVKASVALRLFQDSWDDQADKVMDHLIHGKPLPPCEIKSPVDEALRNSGVSLRPYQLEGIAWLRFLQTVKLNGALTDAMGLGKTLQSLVGIALAHQDSENGECPKSIVICPSSVVGHWMKEIPRFFPGKNVFRPFCLRGSRHKKEEPNDCNLIVTSYSVLRAEINYLSGTKWRYCVLDEGHLLKNPKTATAKAAKRLIARHRLILTGTPVQNTVHEVWATFDFLMPNFLGSSSNFSKDFARPITKSQSSGASASDIALGMEKLKLLHQQVLPFILRREKEDVLKELPPKIITSIPCEMSPRQNQLYQDFCSSNQGRRSIGAFNRVLQEPSSDAVIPSLGSDILKALLYLRLVCTHPALVDSNGISVGDVRQLASSGKLVALKEILRETGMRCQDMSAADNDSSLIYVDADDEQGDGAGKEDIEEALDPDSTDGVASTSLPSYSSPSSSKCLIFAQFTHSLDVVEEFLCQNFPWTQYLRLDGKVPTERRGEIVDSFNNDDSIKILLLTTRIGGLGLNLTGADTVVFLEHDWNPHADLQAMDRAHRIGQDKTVNVYKLVTIDSIEETIMKLHETKLAMSDAIVNAENSTLHSMGTDQLLDIFRFRSENSGSKAKDVESNLDILVERYEDEYTSLSVGDFIKSFKARKEASGA